MLFMVGVPVTDTVCYIQQYVARIKLTRQLLAIILDCGKLRKGLGKFKHYTLLVFLIFNAIKVIVEINMYLNNSFNGI